MRALKTAFGLLALALAGCSGGSSAIDAGPRGDAGGPRDASEPDGGDDPSRVPFDTTGASVLTVFPHPDDEVNFAPILGKLCNDLDGECTMLVLTRGEAGNCQSPDGCDADLGAQRAQEMMAAAQLYEARLIHWDWGDGRAAEWAERVGGGRELVDAVADVVDEVAPDIVFVHDPRHGNYCHPDHRAAATLALSAVDQLGIETQVYAHEGTATPHVRTSYDAEPRPIEDEAIVYFDATEHLPSIEDQAWDYIARNMWRHRSQTPAGSIAELRDRIDVSDGLRRVYMLRPEDAMEDDPRYEVCP